MSYNTLRSQMLFLSLPTFCTSGTFLRLERSKDLNWQSGINKFHLFNWKHMDLYGSLAPQGVGKKSSKSLQIAPPTSPNSDVTRTRHLESNTDPDFPRMDQPCSQKCGPQGFFSAKAFPTPMTPITPAFTYFAQKKQSHKNGFVYIVCIFLSHKFDGSVFFSL